MLRSTCRAPAAGGMQQPRGCSALPLRGWPARPQHVRPQRGSRLVPRTAAPSLDAPPAAPAPAPAPPQQASSPAPASGAAADAAPPFSWTKAWWPVAPLHYLNPKQPLPVTMLGHTYVVWYDRHASKWRVMEDRCPHRLAPLSEGRIDADGTLMCSYHGWQFDGAGACTRIPQIGDADKMAAACASPRACVASFPTTEVEGLLFAWLESGPQAEAEAAASKPFIMPEQVDSGVPWTMTELPTDYTFWLEQGMDPTHANFLHHTCGFPMSDALPMPGDAVVPADVSLQGGYTWHHGNYTTKHQGMQAERQFVPPNTLRVVYDRGFVRGFSTMGVPVRPGVSRVFGRFSFGGFGNAKQQAQQRSPLARLMARLPHWVFMPTLLADQDTVVNMKQEVYMRSLSLTPRDYAAFARADQGILAAHRWFDAAGYEAMWRQRLGPQAASGSASSNGSANGSSASGNSSANGSASGSDNASASASGAGSSSGSGGARYAYQPYTAPSEAQAFDWYQRHTKHCPQCQAGMRLTAAAANAAAVLGVLATALAAGLAVAAKSLASPAVAAAALAAAACAWARAKLLQFRHEQFFSTSGRWQRQGGLSLVRGDPVQLDLPPQPARG